MHKGVVIAGLIAALAACETADQQQPLDGFGRPLDGHAAVPTAYLKCVNTTDFDTPPKLVRGTIPLYPVGRQLAAQEGSVEANYTVSALGQIEDLSLSSVDSTNPDSVWFRNHAEIAMRGWRIEPAKRANGPVRATCRTVFKFKLE